VFGVGMEGKKMTLRLPRLFCVTVLCCLSVSGAGDAEGEAMRVGAFSLDDQHKERHDHTFPKERVSIFALADRKGSGHLEGWIEPFYKRYGEEVEICGVANLKGVPRLMQPVLRGVFRKGVDYPVMMDWRGKVCTAFGYRPGEADIFIVDFSGTVSHRACGEADPEKLERCFAVIDGLVKEAEASASAGEGDGPAKAKAPLPPATTSGEPGQES
jgi:hypothetical protein